MARDFEREIIPMARAEGEFTFVVSVDWYSNFVAQGLRWPRGVSLQVERFDPTQMKRDVMRLERKDGPCL